MKKRDNQKWDWSFTGFVRIQQTKALRLNLKSVILAFATFWLPSASSTSLLRLASSIVLSLQDSLGFLHKTKEKKQLQPNQHIRLHFTRKINAVVHCRNKPIPLCKWNFRRVQGYRMNTFNTKTKRMKVFWCSKICLPQTSVTRSFAGTQKEGTNGRNSLRDLTNDCSVSRWHRNSAPTAAIHVYS